MRLEDIYIEIQYPDKTSGVQSVAFTYDMDTGPLQMPEHIKIGGSTWDNHPITNYDEQVGEYDVWLEDQIKDQNPDVLEALDDIYNKALNAGIILTTRSNPCPNITHAHVVKRVITNLAKG